MPQKSRNPKGLTVKLDHLEHKADLNILPHSGSHAFIYFLTVYNQSKYTITLLGRKWVINKLDGSTLVVEGEKIVGHTPTLPPGESFSYNSYHITDSSALALGSLHGIDENGNPVFVKIPELHLHVDEDN